MICRGQSRAERDQYLDVSPRSLPPYVPGYGAGEARAKKFEAAERSWRRPDGNNQLPKLSLI
jgi:hypothetical protein